MPEFLRSIKALIALSIAAATSAALYHNHLNRAAREGDLCHRVERHVVALNSDVNGVVLQDPTGLVDSIRDRCDSHFSKAQANCILRATSIPEVRACR